MFSLRTRSVFVLMLLTIGCLFVAMQRSYAQTFRGGVNGTVTDQSGAMVPDAVIEIVNAGTSASSKTVSSSAGEFSFRDVPVGTYFVKVSASGFQPQKIQGVPVSAGTIYTLPIKLDIASTGVTVEVSADSLTLDTTS